MGKKSVEISIGKRIISIFLLNIFIINILPAQAISTSIQQGKVRLEYYLDLANQEFSESKWKQLASDGMVTALSVWESNASSFAEDEETFENVKAIYENIVSEKFVEWKTRKYLEENNSLESSVISRILEKAAKDWEYTTEDGSKTRTILESQTKDARKQWENYATNLVSKYLTTSNFSADKIIGTSSDFTGLTSEEIKNLIEKTRTSYEVMLYNECEDIIQAEGNDLMRYLLYDQYSMRKMSDSEAATVIANSLANQANTETTNNLNSVFAQIDTYIKDYSDADLAIAQEEWFSNFSRVMEESLDRWNKAEAEFLVKRVEWEKSASEIYANDEEVWGKAYNVLIEKEREWKVSLIEKIQAGQEKWNSQKKSLNEELNKRLKDYTENLKNEKSMKEKIIEVHVSTYNTSRDILSMSSEGIKNWYNNWTDKYRGLYSYWKTEAESKNDALDKQNNEKTTYNSEDNLAKLKVFEESEINKLSDFEKSSYVVTEEDVQKILLYINNWKESYIEAVKREIQKIYNYKQSRINKINDKVASLAAEIDEITSDIQNPNNQQYNQEIEEKQKAIEFLQGQLHIEKTNLTSIKSYIDTVAKIDVVKYTDYSSLKDFDGRQIEDENAKIKKVLKELRDEKNSIIVTMNHGSVPYTDIKEVEFEESNILRHDILFADEKLVYGSEGTLYTWLYSHVQYVKECKEEIAQIFKYTGSIATIQIDKMEDEDSSEKTEIYYDELTLEYLKAEALKDYWAEQKEILETCLDYINNETSTSDTLEETKKQLEEAISVYNTAEAAYIAECEELEKKAKEILSAKENLKNKEKEIAEKFEALNKARENYNSVLEAYNGVSNDALRSSIEGIISQINGLTEDKEEAKINKANYLKEYYNAYQKYLTFCLEKDKKTVIASLVEGDESKGLASEKTLLKKLYAEDFIDAQNQEILYSYLSAIPALYQMEAQYIQNAYTNMTSENVLPEQKTLYEELIRKAVESINLSNEQELKRREYAKNYIQTGSCTTDDITYTDANIIKKKALLTAAKNIISFVEKNNISSGEILLLSEISEEIERLLGVSFENFENAISESKNEKIKDILCGHNIFKDNSLNIIMSFEYTNVLWSDSDGINLVLSEIAKTVEEDYFSYNSYALQEQNDEARKEVAAVIEKHSTNITAETLKIYLNELYEAGQNLNSVGQIALENYISEYIKQYILKNLSSFDAESLTNKLKGDNEKLVAIQGNLMELDSWQSVSSFIQVLNIMSSSSLYSKKDKDLINVFSDYAAVLLYEQMVISKREITENSIKDFLKSYKDKYPENSTGIPKNFYITIETKILDFYNNSYSDFDTIQKELLKYLKDSSEISNDSTKAYESALELTKSLKEIRNYWDKEENKETEYLKSLSNQANDVFKKLFGFLPQEDQKIINAELEKRVSENNNIDDIKAKLISDYSEKLKKVNEECNYSREDYINVFNTILETFKGDDGKQLVANLSIGTVFYNENEVNFYAEQQKKLEYETAVTTSSFNSYDFNMLDKDWYNAYLAGSDLLYVYLSIKDNDIDLINEVLEYEKKYKLTDGAREKNISKLEKYSTIKNLIKEYSPYFDEDIATWLKSQGFSEEDDIYNAVYENIVYGVEYHTESHYEEDMKSLRNTIGSIETHNAQLTSGKFLKAFNEKYALFSDKIAELHDNEYKLYSEANYEYMFDNLALENLCEDLSYQEEIIKEVNANNKKNGVEGDFVISEVSQTVDFLDAYKQYFTQNNSTWEMYTNNSITGDEDDKALQKTLIVAQNKIDAMETTRFSLLGQLQNIFVKLQANQEDVASKLTELKEKKDVYDDAEKAYNIAVESYNTTDDSEKNETKTAMGTYKDAVNNYNAELAILNSKYETMEDARVAYRKANEIYEWAENTYLRVESEKTGTTETEKTENSEDMIVSVYKSPEERFITVSNSYEAAMISVEVLKELIHQLKETEEENLRYKDELLDFENAEKNYYMARVLSAEVSSAISAQRNLLNNKMAEEAEAIAKILNTNTYDEISTKKPYSLPDGISSLIMVTTTTDENGKTIYSFTISKDLKFEEKEIKNEEGSTIRIEKEVSVVDVEKTTEISDEQNKEILEKYLNDVLGQVQVDAYDNEYNERLSQQEAEAWLKEMNSDEAKDKKYFDKVILAAIYLESIVYESKMNDENLEDFLGDFRNLTSDETFKLNNIEKMHQVDYPAAMICYGKEFLEECYKTVSKEDIAKYLLYKDTYLGSSLKLKERAYNYLRINAMEKTIDYANDYKIGFNVAGGVFTALAAGFYALAATIWNLWALIPAAANTVLAAYEFVKARDTQGVMDKISSLQDGEKELLSKNIDYMANSITSWNTKSENVKAVRKDLNMMLYGTETAPEEDLKNVAKIMTYESFIDAINKSLADNKNITIENVKELITKENFEEVNGNGKNVDEVIRNVVSYYLNVTEIKKSKLQTKVFGGEEVDEKGNIVIKKGLVEEQQENAEAYYTYLNDYLSGKIMITEDNKENIKNNLKELATKAWGSGTFKSNVYYSKLVGVYLSLDKDKVRYDRGTENYIFTDENNYDSEILSTGVINSYVAAYLEALDAENNIKFKQKKYELDLVYQDLLEQERLWNAQVNYIIDIGNKEWKKAAERINNDHNTWKANFDEAYEKASAEWNKNYKEFQESKQQWTMVQYMNASQGKWEEATAVNGSDLEKTINDALQKSGLIGKINDSLEGMASDVESYIDSITNTALLNSIMDSASNLSTRAGIGTKKAKAGNEISRDAEKWLDEAQAKSVALQKEYDKVAAKLSEQQMRAQLEATIDGYMARIDSQNESMREWEEKLVLADGYTVNGRQIERETIVDSTLIKNVKKHQTVRMYEDFKIARPEIRVDSTDGMTGESAMEKILLAAENAKKWAEDVFGKTKYVTDKKGNVVSSTVSRKISKKDFENNGIQVAEELVENYKVSAEKYKESEDKQSENIKRLSELEEKIKSKGYNELSDSEKEEYGNLTGEITELSDGAINEWIGYAPTFKSPSELDYNASAESNVMYKGMGQMGIIMLDFQWNSMVEGNGFKELAKPMYDKKMWDDNGSWFEPPTFRDVLDIALEVVGNATGQKWVGWLDDALFATTDLTGGYKSAEEVGLELGKKALTTVVSAGMGAASNYLGDLAGEALQGASKFANFAAQAGISMGTNYVTSVANSAVNSFYIGENGLAFNTDGFTKSLYSADTISGAIGAGITAGLNATTIGYNNQYVNGFNSQQIRNIKTFNSLMGGLTTNTSSLLMGGNANLNLLSYKGVGMLEFSFGKDGIKSKIGMGGTNISMQNLVGAFGGATNLHKNSQINNIGYDKTTLDALRSQWGFGDEVAKDQLDDIINGGTVLKFDATGSEVAQSVTKNGRKIIHLNSSQNNGFIDLGLTLQHEAHRDGFVSDAQSQFIETANAVAGHTKMALAMTKDKLYTKDMLNYISSDSNLQNDINAYMYAAYTGNTGLFAGYVGANYDSSADYWRVISKSDGTHSIEWDGSRNITIEYQDKDENGNWKKVGEDFFKDDTGSMAGSLGKLFGKERAEQLLGSNITNSDLYDTQTLKDVLGLSDADISKIQRSGKLPSNVTELQLYKLIGESLMKNNGITWNVSNENNSGFWDVSGLADSSIYGNKLTSFTLTDNNTMGYILFNELGTNQNINNGINSHTYFDRFVVTAELIRDERSFDAFYMRKTDSQGNSYDNQFDSRKSLESQNRGLDEIIYRKYDLNNNQLGESFITYAQTLDVYNTTQEKIDRNQPYYLFGEGWGQGNSVNSNFSLTINSLNTSDDWVMTLHNFYTIGNFNKNWVNSFSSNGLPGGAWGVHSSDYLTSDGCFIYTRPNRIEVQKRLNEWGLHSNHQIYGILR